MLTAERAVSTDTMYERRYSIANSGFYARLNAIRSDNDVCSSEQR